MTAPRTFRYGPADDQAGDLHLPTRSHPPVVCLLHGGFWRMPYGRDQLDPIAKNLAAHGFAVWNLGYRRLGEPGGGWPGTLEDVAAGVDHLARLAGDGVDLDLGRIAAAGHSAGGHLALWVAARRRVAPFVPVRVRITLAVGLAPIADLAGAAERRLGSGAVAELLGAEPGERLRAASPRELLPLGVPQLILHGTADDAVPIQLSRDYTRAAAAAGDSIELVELPDTGHMEYLDPGSSAYRIFRERLTALAG